MRHSLKAAALIALMVFVTLIADTENNYSDGYPLQPAPEMLEINPFYIDQPQIGYSQFDGYYADLQWSPLELPDPPDSADYQYINFYLQEVIKPYRPSKPTIIKEANISGTLTKLRMGNLASGTVYYTHARDYYNDVEGGNIVYTSPESNPSNNVKFMTDINIEAYPYAANKLRITWDDVWDSGKRINYKLYVSESSDFSNTPPMYIDQQSIEPEGPVKVLQDVGKLEYVHTVSDAARVYYIKIKPEVDDSQMYFSEESKTIMVNSLILAKTTRMASSDYGTIWNIEWTPVITGLNSGNVDIVYQIYRGIKDSQELPQYLAATAETNFFLTLQQDEDDTYYIIRAIVKKNGEDLYPGISIESDKIEIKEAEIPAHPAAPELTDSIKNNFGDDIINYQDQLTAHSATIIWRAPHKSNGEVDELLVYDIWLLTEPTQLDAPPEGTKIASSIIMENENKVLDGAQIKGYKYTVSGLDANETYYLRITASKSFLEYIEGSLESVTYFSDPSVKVIITPSDGPVESPPVPGRPPLGVKRSAPPEERYIVDEDSAVISLKNKWYEHYNSTLDLWEYISVEELNSIDEELISSLENETCNDINYRIVQYANDVTFDIGCIEYSEGLTFNDLFFIPANKVIAFPSTPNDPFEDVLQNPDGKAHNVDIIVSDLEPNKSYVIWARASRISAGTSSGPSDPIVVTTAPLIMEPLEKPVVPQLNYNYPGDIYIDLGWDFKPVYNYYIKYSTEDDIKTAGEAIEIKPEDILFEMYYRVEDLEQNKLYYFWIQAEAFNAEGDTSPSDWSDSYPVATLPYIPPDTPKGFGIKNSDDSVTKNSITFEWLKEEGLLYILEISRDISYKNSNKYSIENNDEYTVTNLLSNYRYYARLYAYDPEKKVQSEPTLSISVRTKSSSDDYDSDQDVEKVEAGEYVKQRFSLAEHTLFVDIMGSDADRFLEAIGSDSYLDYEIDLKQLPEGAGTIKLKISQKVFLGLEDILENLLITTPYNKLVFSPYIFSGINSEPVSKNYIEIIITLNEKKDGLPYNTELKSNITGLEIFTAGSGSRNPAGKLNRPLKAVFEYNGSNWYKKGTSYGYTFDNSTFQWQKHEPFCIYDNVSKKGFITLTFNKVGSYCAGNMGNHFFSDISGSKYESSINNIAALYTLEEKVGGAFRPTDYITLAEALKMVLTLLNYKYDEDYAITGFKAGITEFEDIYETENRCSRQKLVYMAVSMLELKIGEQLAHNETLNLKYKDIDDVYGKYYKKVLFGLRNGIATTRSTSIFGSDDTITRGEFMFILERALSLAGEL